MSHLVEGLGGVVMVELWWFCGGFGVITKHLEETTHKYLLGRLCKPKRVF